jgi:VWFA-related protein
MRVTIAGFFIAGLMAAQTGAKFEATAQLVVVNISAKDKSGEAVTGLKASDFTVTEDGKAQQIKVFEFQKLEDAALVAPATVKAVVTTQIAPARAGEVKYKDSRLLVLFFDQAGMPVADQIRAQQAALKFLDARMTQSDLVAVLRYSTDLTVMQDFTNDRDRLTKVVKGLSIGDVGMTNGSTGAASEGDTGAAYTADDNEFNIFNTDRKLAALESAVKMLASLPEKKALVYFASGMSRTGIDNQAQLRATINAAIRGNVAFYPVDARGLVATAPLGDATQNSPGGQGMYSGSSQRTAQENFQGQQETLYTLASDTGGKALLDQNDLSLGIVQAQKDISSYYILGYYSTNTALDGRYRRIKVQINGNLTAKLDYRSGYFAGKEFKQFTNTDRESQLKEALMLGDGGELFPAGEGPVFRSGVGEDTGQRHRAGQERRSGDDAARFHRRSERRQGGAGGERPRRYYGQAEGRDGGAIVHAQPGIRHWLHASAGDLHAEIPGARERNREDGDV